VRASSPHIGFNGYGAVRRIPDTTIDNVRAVEAAADEIPQKGG